MKVARPLSRHGSEYFNRMDWWLREYGRLPTYAQLRRIRTYKREMRAP